MKKRIVICAIVLLLGFLTGQAMASIFGSLRPHLSMRMSYTTGARDALLMESRDALLLESEDKILLEG